MTDRLPHEKGFHVSWDQIHRDARALAWRLDGKGPGEGGSWKAVVGITRGGLVPAMIVSRELDIRVVDTISVKSYHSGGGAADQRFLALCFAVKRVDADGIGGDMDQLFVEIRPFKHGFNAFQPVLMASRRYYGQKNIIGHPASPISEFSQHLARKWTFLPLVLRLI